jgi:thiosulfate/3-mercaptopyruvate sulfurtransferase
MSTLTLVAVVASSGLLVSPADLAREKTDPAVVVVHVSDRPADFDAGHIPGARHLPYDRIAVDGPERLGSELPPVADLVRAFTEVGVTDASRVVLYGSAIAATRAFFTLEYLGHPNVRVLNGGIGAWRAAGLAVETGPARSVGQSAGAFSPKPRPDVVAMADWIVARLETPQMALVDARPDAEFTGADGGMNGMHPVGHLPGARQLVWTDLVTRESRFLPDADLRRKMEAAGARSGVPVVSYCMIGMRASVIYFVARHLGFDAKMYDGSIVDWGHRKLPVRKGTEP